MIATSGTLVSIYIPTKNRKELLKRALNSCLAQSHKNIEIIVIDDGSTDGTIEYLSELRNSDNRVKVLTNESSLGACASRNRAIHLATGKFITGLDDDDYFTSDRIYKFLEAWPRKEQSTLALYSDSKFFFQSGKQKKTNRPKFVNASCLIDSNLIGNQIFVEASTFKSTGGFDQNFPAWQDLEYWYRILNQFPHCTFQKVKATTYIVDASHAHERISSSKISNIEKAFFLFAKKHNLSTAEKEILSIQMHMYHPTKNPYKGILLKLKRKTSLRNIKYSVNAFIKFLFKTKNQNI